MQIKEVLVAVTKLDAEAKVLREEKALVIEKFAKEKNMTIKGVKKGLKELAEFLKDKAEYTTTDLEAAKLLEEATK